MAITGNYFGGPGSQLVLEVSGSQHDTLQVGGTVQLDSTASISIVIDPANPPPADQTFTLVDDSSATPLVKVVIASDGGVAVQTSGAASQVPTTVSTGGTVSTVVEIDVKPGSPKNKVKIKGQGALPVAILSEPTFYAPTVIDPATLRLAGASVRLKGKKNKPKCHAEDVNHDNVADLVCKVEIDELELQEGNTLAVLNASSFPDCNQPNCPRQHFTGSQAVTVKN